MFYFIVRSKKKHKVPFWFFGRNVDGEHYIFFNGKRKKAGYMTHLTTDSKKAHIYLEEKQSTAKKKAYELSQATGLKFEIILKEGFEL